MPLRNFPSTFGITELKKGYFPYTFDTLANASSSSGTKRPRALLDILAADDLPLSDPFQFVTIASHSMHIERSCFLEPDEIGVIRNDAPLRDKHSAKAIRALDYMAYTTKSTIVHAGNGNEPANKLNSVNHKTMARLHEDTIRISAEIRQHLKMTGGSLVEIWECKHDREHMNDNVSHMHHECEPNSDEIIRHVDFVSLYPKTCKH